jgi:hypothetical protein
VARRNRHKRWIEAQARAVGVEGFEIEVRSGGHYRLTLHHRGRSRFVSMGATLSDHRAQKNIRARIRRTAQELKA